MHDTNLQNEIVFRSARVHMDLKCHSQPEEEGLKLKGAQYRLGRHSHKIFIYSYEEQNRPRARV